MSQVLVTVAHRMMILENFTLTQAQSLMNGSFKLCGPNTDIAVQQITLLIELLGWAASNNHCVHLEEILYEC